MPGSRQRLEASQRRGDQTTLVQPSDGGFRVVQIPCGSRLSASNRSAIESDQEPAEFKSDDRWGRHDSLRWSGARNLNPGPRGPEPAVCRVLWCPGVSLRVLPHSI